MSNQADVTVFIGRFSPFHNAHAAVLKRACKNSNRVLVLIGSSWQPRNIKNPFTFEEREKMIYDWLVGEGLQNQVMISPLRDHPYNDQVWYREIQELVEDAAEHLFISKERKDLRVVLTGSHRDASTWYLGALANMFELDIVTEKDIGYPAHISATHIREMMFDFDYKHIFEVAKDLLPESTRSFLREFILESKEYWELVKEYEFIKKYKESWKAAPYPPTFVTTDAVVVQSGHVLLIERGAEPGKGLWALPGGFLNQEERLEDGMLRELREETRLKVPEPVLRGNIKTKEIFDHPGRSLRGRTITTAYLIHLPDGQLPKVKGSDDAKKAFWVPLNEAIDKTENFYEDHHAIMCTMIGRIKD